MLEQLAKLIKQKKSKEFYAKRLSEITGEEVSVEEVEALLRELRGEEEEPIKEGTKSTWSEDLKTGKAELSITLPSEIRTLEELIEKTNIDTTKWNVDKYIQNFWGSVNNPQYQVKAWLSPVKAEQSDLFAEVIENYQSSYKPLSKKDILINDVYTEPTCLLISLSDFHLAKLDQERTSIEDKAELYTQVLDKLLYRAYKGHNIDEIVFLIGNDFCHTDNFSNMTTAFTPQDVSTQWHHEYEVGFDLMVKSISKLKQFCNKLNVIHVPSNHARTKEFYMAHALEVYFKAEESIVFNRTAENTKVYTYYNNFLGFHHGDTDFNKLPLYFASKYYQEWGQTKHRDLALSDKHHRKAYKFSMEGNEVDGIRMFICPSLSGTDKWHLNKGYDLAQKAAIGRVYNRETGYCTEYEERI